MKTIVFLVSESTLGPIFMQFCRKVISKTRIHKLKKIWERRQTKVNPMKSQTPEIRVNGNIRQFSIESQPTHIYSLPLSINPSIWKQKLLKRELKIYPDHLKSES